MTKQQLAERNRSYQYKFKCVDCGKAVTREGKRCRKHGIKERDRKHYNVKGGL